MNPLAPLAPEAWSPRHAMHLVNRAGFGVPFPHAARLSDVAPEEAVALMVDYEPAPAATPPDFLLQPRTRTHFKRENPDADVDALQKIYQDYQRDERQAIQRLQAWWFERMYTSANPLQEKMALFWHGHFATSAQKVKYSLSNYQLYESFSRHATGNFKALTIAVGQSVAMLHYLDNRKSTKAAPNENWARELMELFTLGQGHYSEEDIKNSARAFTGWTCNEGEFQYSPERQDTSEKTFMGRSGNFDGWNIIDIIFEQPACAEFIAAKMWRYFAGTEPTKEIRTSLAATLRDSHYELRPMLRQMFASRAFYTPEVMGAQIKSPVQFMLRLCSDLRLDPPPYSQLTGATRSIGQDLFYPPNVKGWDGNRAWINANSLLVRCNLPAAMLAPPRKRKPQSMETMMAADEMQMEGTRPRKQRRAPQPKEHVFEALEFTTAGACIDAIAARFLAIPMGTAQRKALMEVLEATDPAQPLSAVDIPAKQRVALLRLVTSMAEYQLC